MSDSSWAPFGPGGDDDDPPEKPAPAEEAEPVAFEPPLAPPPPSSSLNWPTPTPTPPPAPAPPPVGHWPGPPPQAYGAPRHLAGKATASLVLGIVGLVVCPLVASVPAIVLGRAAKREIAERPEELGGQSQANWGIALGWLGTALGVLILLVVVLGTLGAITTSP